MITTQIPSQSVSTNVVDAIWALVQCQSKSVQRALMKRFVVLDAEQQTQRETQTISCELQTCLDTSRKDIEEGRGIVCHSKNELQAFLAAL